MKSQRLWVDIVGQPQRPLQIGGDPDALANANEPEVVMYTKDSIDRLHEQLRQAEETKQRLVAQVTEALLCVERDQERARQAEARATEYNDSLKTLSSQWHAALNRAEAAEAQGAALLAEVERLREFVAAVGRALSSELWHGSEDNCCCCATARRQIDAVLAALAALDAGEAAQ